MRLRGFQNEVTKSLHLQTGLERQLELEALDELELDSKLGVEHLEEQAPLEYPSLSSDSLEEEL